MNRIESLLAQISSDLEVMHQLGFSETKRELISPSTAKAGFIISYARGQDLAEIEFLDDQIEVRLNSRELFGPILHSGFGGNMFPAEKLQAHLPNILNVLRPHAS